jgi:enoyl-CoA hydratase/carnithine racemase
MGLGIAYQVLWKGRKLSGEEAVEFGLVDALVDSRDELLSTAVTEAQNLAKDPTSSSRYQQRLQDRQALVDTNSQECNVLQKAWVSARCFKALAKFLDSRNMKAAALVLKLANTTGQFWGQPPGVIIPPPPQIKRRADEYDIFVR